MNTGEPISEQSLTLATEKEYKVVFDPINEWVRIRDSVSRELDEAGEGNNFDKRMQREHQLMDELAETLVSSGAVENWAEMNARLRAVDSAKWGLRESQRLNSRLFEGFEIDEVIDLRTITELIGIENYYHPTMAYWRKSGQIDNKWVPIDTVDAVCVTTGLAALAMKEGIPFGRKAVDLGGGDGTWGFVMAKLGFDVTLIERDHRLLEWLQVERGKLEELGINARGMQIINGEFSTDDTKNTPEIKTALREADVMVSYPWPEEVIDRMRLFSQYGKEGSLLVMYGGGLDGFAVDSQDIAKYGLEVVGTEINEELKHSGNKQQWVRGYNTPSFGANWVVLRRTGIKKKVTSSLNGM